MHVLLSDTIQKQLLGTLNPFGGLSPNHHPHVLLVSSVRWVSSTRRDGHISKQMTRRWKKEDVTFETPLLRAAFYHFLKIELLLASLFTTPVESSSSFSLKSKSWFSTRTRLLDAVCPPGFSRSWLESLVVAVAKLI